MAISTRPFLVVYVAWHPAFAAGRVIAKKLYDQYRRELYGNVTGGAGLSVIYRNTPDPATSAPPHIDLVEGETTAVVLLVDENLAGDEHYLSWARNITAFADAAGLGARVFPVSIDGSLTRLGMAEQAVRWDRWNGIDDDSKLRRLTSDLTYQFCRMLRSYLEGLLRPEEDETGLEQYLKKVQIFLILWLVSLSGITTRI